MSLSDNDTTIVAGLADAGQRITSLSSNIGSLQALLGDVTTTVMDPGTAVAGTMPCYLDLEPAAFQRNYYIILKDHDACLKGDGTGCPHALAWVFWSHEDGEMHRIG